MPTLFESFSANAKPVITMKMLQDLERFTASYEVRDNNALAFNTPLLGVTKAYWYQKDADYIFAIFGIDKDAIISGIKLSPSIDKNFNVTSNEFNILVIWLIHLIRKTASLNQKMKYDAQMNLLKLLNYKFFCGKVAMQFQYGAKEPVMQYTIDNLTAKSDIKNEETNTWKKLIYKHCTVALEPGSIFQRVFDTFMPDLEVAKAISDVHTRICRKIVLISEAYYENNKKGNAYGTSSIMTEDAESGGKVLGNLAGTLDLVISRVSTAALNLNSFLDQSLITLTTKMTSNIRRDNVIEVLTLFSDMATQQMKSQETRTVSMDRNRQPIYTGYALLLEEMIQKTYRRAALMGVDINAVIPLIQATKNTYTASRVIDKDIGIIKNSVDVFLQRTKYTRQGTLVSLRVAFIIYIMLLASYKFKNKNN
jgi:hypothetical protein